MRNLFAGVSEFIETHSLMSKKTIAMLSVLIIVLAIPLTVYISQQQQELRQQASGTEVNGIVYQSFVDANGRDGYAKRCPVENGTIRWDLCPTFGHVDLSVVRGVGNESYRNVDSAFVGNRFWQNLVEMDGRRGWYQRCPVQKEKMLPLLMLYNRINQDLFLHSQRP